MAFVKKLVVYNKKARRIQFSASLEFNVNGSVKYLPSTLLYDLNKCPYLELRVEPLSEEDKKRIITWGRCPRYPQGRYYNLYNYLFRNEEN